MLVAPGEAQDYDFLTRWDEEGQSHITPVQLKEWVPANLNRKQELSDLLQQIAKKYRATPQTQFAIHVNRAGHIDLGNVEVPPLPVGGVYLFGALDEYQSEWFIYGDLLGQAFGSVFRHPEPEDSDPNAA